MRYLFFCLIFCGLLLYSLPAPAHTGVGEETVEVHFQKLFGIESTLVSPDPDSSYARVCAAFGSYWNLKDAQGKPRSATVEEIVAELKRFLKARVEQEDLKKKTAAITVKEWEGE